MWSDISKKYKALELTLFHRVEKLQSSATSGVRSVHAEYLYEVIYELGLLRLHCRRFRQAYCGLVLTGGLKVESRKGDESSQAAWYFQEDLTACVRKCLIILRMQLRSANSDVGNYGALCFLRRLYSDRFSQKDEAAMYLLDGIFGTKARFFMDRKRACSALCYFEMVFIGLNDSAPNPVRDSVIGKAHLTTITTHFVDLMKKFEVAGVRGLNSALAGTFDASRPIEARHLSRFFRNVDVHLTDPMGEFIDNVLGFCYHLVEFCLHDNFEMFVCKLPTVRLILGAVSRIQKHENVPEKRSRCPRKIPRLTTVEPVSGDKKTHLFT